MSVVAYSIGKGGRGKWPSHLIDSTASWKNLPNILLTLPLSLNKTAQTRNNLFLYVGELGNKQTKSFPGPGNYEPKHTRYNTSPQWGLGTAKRPAINRVSNNPGPQQYDMPTKIGEGSKYSVGQKLGSSMGTNKMVPGPGAYTRTGDFDFRDPTNPDDRLGKNPKFAFGIKPTTKPRNLD